MTQQLVTECWEAPGRFGYEEPKQRAILEKAYDAAADEVEPSSKDLIWKDILHWGLWAPHQIIKEEWRVPSLEETTDRIAFDNQPIHEAYGIEEEKFWSSYKEFKDELFECIAFRARKKKLKNALVRKIGFRPEKAQEITNRIRKKNLEWELDRYVNQDLSDILYYGDGGDLKLKDFPKFREVIYEIAKNLSEYSKEEAEEVIDKIGTTIREERSDLERILRETVDLGDLLAQKEIEEIDDASLSIKNLMNKLKEEGVPEEKRYNGINAVLSEAIEYWSVPTGERALAACNLKSMGEWRERFSQGKYGLEGPYPLAKYWVENGNPPFRDKETVHSKLGRAAAELLYDRYSSGDLSIPAELLRLIKKGLNVELEKPPIWKGEYMSIKNPKFGERMLGGIAGSLIEGNSILKNIEGYLTVGRMKATAPLVGEEIGMPRFHRGLTLLYGYRKRRRERGKEAFRRLKEKIGVFKTIRREVRGKRGTSILYVLPLILYETLPEELQVEPGSKRLSKEGKEYIKEIGKEHPGFAKAFAEQAILDQGYEREEAVGIVPYYPKIFRSMLEDLGMKEGKDYRIYPGINYKGGKEFRISPQIL